MNKRSGRFPTLKEIAKVTGYSVMTVSRALNHPEMVQKETREEILRAVKEKNYNPNSIARALSSGKTSIIYVYIPQDYAATNPFFMQVVAGMGESFGEEGYSLLIRRNWYAGEVCDGIVLMGLRENDIVKAQELASSKNVILFGHVEGIDSLDVNNYEGMKLLTEHILSRGKKRLMLLSIDEKRPFVHDREKGFLAASSSASSHDIYHSENQAEAAYSFMKETFGKEVFPYDAICCSSDDMALGVLRFLRDLNLRCPEDVAVGGFDGLGKHLSSLPPLTTIKQPIYEIGKELANRLEKRIAAASSYEPISQFVTPILIEGGTT